MSTDRYRRWLTVQEQQCLAACAHWQQVLDQLTAPSTLADESWTGMGQWQDWAAGLPARRKAAEEALQQQQAQLQSLRQQQSQWDRWHARTAQVQEQQDRRRAQRLIDEQWGVSRTPSLPEGGPL